MAELICIRGEVGPKVKSCWAVLWRSDNRLDGRTRHLIGEANGTTRTHLFPTRAAARAFVQERFGYISERPDLQREPFGWKVPLPVRVTVRISIDG